MTPEATPNTPAYYRALIPDLAARLVELPTGDPGITLAAGILMQAIEEYTRSETRHAGTFDPDPLCPECNGQGYTLTPGSYYDPPEPEDCPVCAGRGTLARTQEAR